MRKTIILTVFMLAVALLSAACQANKGTAPEEEGTLVKVDGGSYRDLSVAGLQKQMENKDFTLINVHIPFEGNLPETDLSIPYDTITHNLDMLPGDKDAKIILYCRSGSMSTTAAKELVKLGYTNIWQLAGGMNAWAAAGLPIER